MLKCVTFLFFTTVNKFNAALTESEFDFLGENLRILGCFAFEPIALSQIYSQGGPVVKVWQFLLLVTLTFLIPQIGSQKTYGANNLVDQFPRPQGFISSQQIKRMSLQDLEKTRDEMNAAIVGLRAILRRQNNNDIPYDKIFEVAKYQTQEALEALITVFREEIKRINPKAGGARPEVFMNVLDAMGAMGTSTPHRYLEEYLDMMQELEAKMPPHPMNAAIGQKVNIVFSVMQARQETLVNLNDLLYTIEQANNGPMDLLARSQKILKEGLIGQPEVLQALMDMEWRSALYGKSRDLPDAIYLMGLPGTGKDTAAEVFTDALYGTKNAHQRHMYRLPLMKSKADLWQVLGSSTGYIGSESFPPFLEFLVQHSGGKYKLEEGQSNGKPVTRVIKNPDYKGETLPGYYAPNKGIVFVNEFHNWSKQLKDDFLKQALEKGVFNINNPNGGLSEIYVPIRFVIASNEGIRLTTSREANGQRQGKPLTYEQMLAKWEAVQGNKRALKAEILSTNGSPNQAVAGESTPGISEELLNRIPERFIILMRPLSPEHLQKIANSYLENLRHRLVDSPLLGKVTLTWTEELPKVLQEYDYIAEENARPVLGRVIALIEEPLLDALREDQLNGITNLEMQLNIETNPDKSRSLVITTGAGRQVRQLIRTTLKDIAKPAISDERIDEMAGLESHLKGNVFGIDDVLERLSERALSIENESAGASARPVNVLMLNGLSSTGKTETAKQLAKFVRKSDDELVTFDFSQIQTLHDFKVKILGLRDGLGNPVPSEFMKYYDRSNGRVIVAFDELANVRDMDLLKALYDFFREPVVSTFSDGKPRAMGGVTVIITGNPGQELFAQVPRSAPMEVQMLAWEEIAKRTNNDPELQRQILEKYYPEPFITRIGRNNIFFLPPHSYKSLRQLAQLKLGQALTRMANEDSRRGWKVVFPSAGDYSQFIDMIIDEGFSLRFQGASIESFVRDDVEEKIKYLLLKNKVPSGTTAVLRFRNKTSNQSEDTPGFVFYDVYVDGAAQPLELKIRRPHIEKPLDHDQTNDLLTAFHEAGHSLVRNTLFKGIYKSTMISVIPGVSLIGDKWIYYAGVAKSSQEKETYTSRDHFVREIAILLAGETAERLVSRGSKSSAGKSNDIERAAKAARNVILRYGLSEKWGLRAAPADSTIDAYISSLPEDQKVLLDREVTKMIEESRDLAEQTIEANFHETFVPLALELAEKGVLNEDELESFYAERQLIDPSQISLIQRTMNHARTMGRKWRNLGSNTASVQLDASIPMPRSFADLDAIARKRKLEQYAEVALPENIPVGTNAAYEERAQASRSSPASLPDKKLGVQAPPTAIQNCEGVLKAG